MRVTTPQQPIIPKILNKTNSAKYLNISMPTLYRLVEQGHLPQPILIGPKRKGFRVQDLDNFIESQ